MKTFAFIIPVYPPHYGYIYRLLESDGFPVGDLHLVFSNAREHALFDKKFKINAIVIPDDVDYKASHGAYAENGTVTFKKFYGLKHLASSAYDYFIVCDSEIFFIKENCSPENILGKIEGVFENKRIYGGATAGQPEMYFKIIEKSASLFGTEDYNRLKGMLSDFSLYCWWSDLPVYKREHLGHFFGLIDSENVNWFQFDHLIYSYYLMLYHGFQAINITPVLKWNLSLTLYNTDREEDLLKLKDMKYGFGFVWYKLYLAHAKFLNREGCFMATHLDREAST